MSEKRNLKAIERDKFLESDEGKRLITGETSGEYLRNRVEFAWCEGWDAASANNHIILGALDTLGIALSGHGHTWSAGEREIYEQAIAAVKQEIPFKVGESPEK